MSETLINPFIFGGWKGSLNPDGDISTELWTTTPLWQKIDEEIASDADFISSKDISSPGFTDTFEISLSNPGGSLNTGDVWKFEYRYRKQGPATIDIQFSLIEGGTGRAVGTLHTNIGTGWTAGSRTLSTGEKNSIGDPNDLRIRAGAFGDTGTATNADVSYIKFIIE